MSHQSKPLSLLAALSLVAAVVSPISKAAIVQPTGATTNMGSFTTFEPVYAINQSGLSVGYVSGVTDFDSYVASTNTVSGGSSFNTWFSASGNTTGNFDFTLGGLLMIESFALWADPQSANQGVNSFNLLADDNAAFTSPTLLGSYSAVDGLGNANNFGQTFAFAPITASHVRMQILSNHGSTITTGFVEAAFEIAEVPVPATVWLFCSSLMGLIGLARRGKD